MPAKAEAVFLAARICPKSRVFVTTVAAYHTFLLDTAGYHSGTIRLFADEGSARLGPPGEPRTLVGFV